MSSTSNPMMILAVVAVVAVLALSYANGMSRRRLLHRERMTALQKGVPLPEDLDTPSPAESQTLARGTALHGTIWTALGIGMFAASHWAKAPELGSDMVRLLGYLRIWSYPATLVGLALLIFAFFAREKR